MLPPSWLLVGLKTHHVTKCFRVFTLLTNSYPTKTNQNNHTWKFSFHLLPSSHFTETHPQAPRSYRFPYVESLCSPVAWKGGSLTKHYTLHFYRTKTFCIECRKIFFHPFLCVTFREAHWPGTSLCQPYFGQ